MATSHYFNNYGSIPEQRVVEDLIVESIRIMGVDVYYLPNDNDQARDLLYGEDPLKTFKTAFPIEIYPNNVMEYGGEKEFFSKFGLEIKNTMTVTMSKRSFSQRVPQNTFTRPREGDLVYVPFLNGTGEIYEITFTNQNKDMMMLGRKVPYFYELTLEKFKYSNEIIDTGIPDVDDVVTQSSYTMHLNLGSGSGDYTTKEIVFQSPDDTYESATAFATVQVWIKSSKTLSVTNIKGEFNETYNIIGLTSNTSYNLSNFNPLENPSTHENYDNSFINTLANSIVDLSETNPFGLI
jgi:hypothetical protein